MLLPELDALLLRHRIRSLRKAPTDFVFSTPAGRPRDHRSTSRGIERAVKRAKLGAGISAHNFRHTYASHLIVGLKEDAVSVAAQLGHTKPSFTQDFYSREFDKVAMDDERRKRYSAGYGHLLNAVNAVETSA
jgi:integrase